MTNLDLLEKLADCPRLLEYAQSIWDRYCFGIGVDDGTTTSIASWNFEEYASNAFCKVPLLPPRTADHANLRKLTMYRDLQRTLRAVEETPPRRQKKPPAAWHRWRMGGPYTAAKKETASDNPLEQQQERNRQRNDEIWFASVAATTIVILLSIGFPIAS